MAELNDYSGEFNPDINYNDFSKEVLTNAVKAFGEFTHKLDGIWYMAVKALIGNDKALACDMKVWERAKGLLAELTNNTFGIKGNDVATAMKTFQLEAIAQASTFDIDLKDNNHAIVTMTHCPSLIALEREGEGREKEICHVVQQHVFRHHASFFNPRMEVQPLKLPPRKSPDEIACQWEFKIEE
ncbi:DUF6125 family protein [Chloroflexota bacterium]